MDCYVSAESWSCRVGICCDEALGLAGLSRLGVNPNASVSVEHEGCVLVFVNIRHI